MWGELLDDIYLSRDRTRRYWFLWLGSVDQEAERYTRQLVMWCADDGFDEETAADALFRGWVRQATTVYGHYDHNSFPEAGGILSADEATEILACSPE